MKLSEIPHSKIEDGVKHLLLNSDRGIGVLIDYQRFFLRPLEKEGFAADAILDTIRGLASRGYFEPYNRGDTSLAELKLTQRGRDEWLLSTKDVDRDSGKEILELKPNFHGISLDIKLLAKKLWNHLKGRS